MHQPSNHLEKNAGLKGSAHGSHESLSRAKAKKILREGVARGRKLSPKQKGLFGLIAGGGTPTRLRKR